jgi:hypothetical protein
VGVLGEKFPPSLLLAFNEEQKRETRFQRVKERRAKTGQGIPRPLHQIIHNYLNEEVINNRQFKNKKL